MTKQSMTRPPDAYKQWIAGFVELAEKGDVKANAMCLYLVGHALLDEAAIDPTLAQYVGNNLIRTVELNASTRSSGTKTEKIAINVARSLGLIGAKRGPRKRRYRPVVKVLEKASVVLHFHSLGSPLTRNENGAFYKAAQVLGSRPGTVESAWREFKKGWYLDDPTVIEVMRILAAKRVKRRRRQR